MKTYCSITFLLVFTWSSVFSQKVSVNRIDETRSTADGSFSNRCEIELKISGDEARKHKFVRISGLNKVADDQGLDLLKTERNDFKYETIDEDAKVKIETRIPARKATLIKELSGELSFYNPTEANGGIIKIANYHTKTATGLLPAASPVQLIYLTKESLDKYQKEQKLKKEEELKKMPEATRKLAEGLLGIVDVFSSIGDDPNQVTFFISGDQTKLVDLYFEDPDGKRKSWNGRSQYNELISYFFEEMPGKDWKLVVNIETPASTQKMPFKITDIELP